MVVDQKIICLSASRSRFASARGQVRKQGSYDKKHSAWIIMIGTEILCEIEQDFFFFYIFMSSYIQYIFFCILPNKGLELLRAASHPPNE